MFQYPKVCEDSGNVKIVVRIGGLVNLVQYVLQPSVDFSRSCHKERSHWVWRLGEGFGMSDNTLLSVGCQGDDVW